MKDFRKNIIELNLKGNLARTIITILLSQSLSFASLPALAVNNAIRIAGEPVFTIGSASGAASIDKRTATVQENLDNALVAAQDHSPASVNITYVNGTPVITLGGYQVLTVSASDAAAFKTTPALLANRWADKIRNALTDQNSVNSYIAQISGKYPSSAPSAAPVNPSNTHTAYNGANTSAGNGQPFSNQGNFAQPRNDNYAPNQSSYDTYSSNAPQNRQEYANNYSNNNAPPNGNYQANNSNSATGQGYRQGRIAYAQAGQIIPATLATSIATQVAKPGDLIEATVAQNVIIGDSMVPAGSQILGQVTQAKAGGRLTHSGDLQIKFNRLRLPDGSETPITAHIVGGIGKFAEVGGDQSDEFKGETTKNKVGSVAFRGLLGAGGGAALGTAIGAIAGGGHGAGMGAWSGAAIGGGLGAADSLLLRKGRDVTVPSGTKIQLQLDSPVAISGVTPAGSYQ